MFTTTSMNRLNVCRFPSHHPDATIGLVAVRHFDHLGMGSVRDFMRDFLEAFSNSGIAFAIRTKTASTFPHASCCYNVPVFSEPLSEYAPLLCDYLLILPLHLKLDYFLTATV
jgi:hypothetical protein